MGYNIWKKKTDRELNKPKVLEFQWIQRSHTRIQQIKHYLLFDAHFINGFHRQKSLCQIWDKVQGRRCWKWARTNGNTTNRWTVWLWEDFNTQTFLMFISFLLYYLICHIREKNMIHKPCIISDQHSVLLTMSKQSLPMTCTSAYTILLRISSFFWKKTENKDKCKTFTEGLSHAEKWHPQEIWHKINLQSVLNIGIDFCVLQNI